MIYLYQYQYATFCHGAPRGHYACLRLLFLALLPPLLSAAALLAPLAFLPASNSCCGCSGRSSEFVSAPPALWVSCGCFWRSSICSHHAHVLISEASLVHLDLQLQG